MSASCLKSLGVKSTLHFWRNSLTQVSHMILTVKILCVRQSCWMYILVLVRLHFTYCNLCLPLLLLSGHEVAEQSIVRPNWYFTVAVKLPWYCYHLDLLIIFLNTHLCFAITEKGHMIVPDWYNRILDYTRKYCKNIVFQWK